MKNHIFRNIHLLLALVLVGCSSLAPLLSPPTSVPALEATSTPLAIPIPTPTAPATDRSRLLRIWLPPRFDPNTGTPSGDLFKARLQEFQSEYPSINIEIRIKSDIDILNTLAVTNLAAPEAMPDLIALSYSDMQEIAAAGFLHPLDGLTAVLEDPDWYAFARELGHVQSTEYGIPFASDVLLTVYRASVFVEPPSTWETIFQSGTSMVFPPSDPNALFSLSLYRSEVGQLVDEQGAVLLNEDALVRLLSFHKQALDNETVLPVIRDYQTDSQTLQFYREGNADLAVIWAASDIQTISGEYTHLLGLGDNPYALGNGWVWALAGSDLEIQPLAAELASYFVDSKFMAEWTRSAGYLPTRPQALAGWDDETLRGSIDNVLQSAHPIPSQDVVSIMGSTLQKALIRIFNGEQPEIVARSVIENSKLSLG